MISLDVSSFVLYLVDMYISRATWPSTNGKSYESIYLRESYREGTHVRKRNIANLTHCDRKEIAAIELALRHKNNLTALASLEQIELHQGPSVGAVGTGYQVAQRLGLRKILGEEFSGHLALWQVLARVLEQGSRLSAVRLVQVHAAGAVLGWQRGFDENDLYDNLTRLSEHQKDIENRLFARRGKEKPQLFLYDVTSSYLEGEHNALGAYGYGRDGKKNKKQIVIGLLCDAQGEPVSVEVFRGNTQDTQTFAAQVNKARVEHFSAERNGYLGEHPRAAVATAEKAVQARIQRLKIDDWLQVEVQGRTLALRVDSAAHEQAARLDGCYVIKTDLPVSAASKQEVHDRYKDLTQVEQAFRTCKTTHLETRPIHVRTEAHTRAHVLVVMLAYLIRRVLSRAWAALDVTVEEGLQQLKALSSTEMKSNDGGSCLRIPKPNPACRDLLQALDIRLPDVLPNVKVRVDTRKKLPDRRKPR